MKEYSRIGIICAMEKEASLLRAQMTDVTEETVSGAVYTSGLLKMQLTTLVVCGIGKVFAAIAAQTMILKFGADLLINTGVGGALKSGMEIGDIVVADALVEHDMDTSPIGDPVGLISGINRIDLPTCKEVADALADAVDDEGITPRRGRIASGDQFVATREQKERILAHFDACVCDMEGAAIAHVAYVNGVDCAVLRAISDNGDEAAAVDYPVFAAEAAEKAARVISRFISSMQKDA